MRREPASDRGYDRLDDDDAERDRSSGGLRSLGARRSLGGFDLAVRLALAAAIVAGLTLAARDRPAPAPSARAWTDPGRTGAEPAVRTAIPAGSAGPLLALDPVGTLDPPARAEPPRWNPATGLREDTLTRGGFDAIEAPFLRLTMTEAGQTPEPATSLFVTLARRAAEAEGLSVMRTGLRGAIETKFGRFETVETTLGGRGSRICTGFAALGTRAMRIDGWLCGVLGQAPEPGAVSCAIESLRLAIAATPTIEVAFGEAELRRDPGCATAGPRTVDETGSVSGRKTTTGDGNSRRPRKNGAELRRNEGARL